MFNKRLMKEFKDNQKYVAGMVATQWVMLAANVILISFIASFMGKMLKNQVTASNMVCLGAVCGAVLIVRAIMNTLNSKMSYAASTRVKRGLRQKIYEKLMSLGGRIPGIYGLL